MLLSLAEAQFINGKNQKGFQTLGHLTILDEKLKKSCLRIARKYVQPDEINTVTSKTTPNLLGIKRCIIVDPDSSIIYYTQKLLKAIGVQEIETFEDGKEAWDYIFIHPEPHLILMEWKIPSISGPFLIQRVRNHGFLQCPIIIISSLIGINDFLLVREMGVDNVITKPFEGKGFYASIIATIQNNRSPAEQKTLEIKIRRLMAADKCNDVKHLISIYLRDRRIIPGCKIQMRAEFAYYQQAFKEASELALAALQERGDTHSLYHLLGKSFLQLKQFDLSLQYFEKAQKLCPTNIERLITIAEIHIEQNNPNKAQEHIHEATKLDQDNDIVFLAQQKVNLETNQTEAVKSYLEGLESSETFIAYMNNRAVSLARSNKLQESIEFYDKAIRCLPKTLGNYNISLHYNLALAHIRSGDMNTAMSALVAIEDDLKPDTTIGKKALSLKQKIRLYRKEKKLLTLEDHKASEDIMVIDYSSKSGPVTTFEKVAFTISDLEPTTPRRGDICCHLLYQYID